MTGIYAAGAGAYVDYVDVISYDKLEHKIGKTTAVVKSHCSYMPYSNSNHGDLTLDVSPCNMGKFKGGHDYAVSRTARSLSPV